MCCIVLRSSVLCCTVLSCFVVLCLVPAKLKYFKSNIIPPTKVWGIRPNDFMKIYQINTEHWNNPPIKNKYIVDMVLKEEVRIYVKEIIRNCFKFGITNKDDILKELDKLFEVKQNEWND